MTEFRRVVLELGHGDADAALMRQAAAFASLARVELHALFVEDDSLLRASALPFTREISPLSYKWQPLEMTRLESDLKAAAERARRQFETVARQTGVTRHFEVFRGDLEVRITQACAVEDIVAIRSGEGAEAETLLARRLRETAHRSAASVLFLPPGPVHAHGPVVSVVTSPEEPGRAVAERIAELARVPLIVLATDGEAPARAIAGTSINDISTALGDTRERLIVMTRDGGATGAELAAARGVPVLVVEPA